MLNGLIQQYSTTPSAGQRRAIGLNLVVFFVFALTAVLMLTRTAVAANAINRDVASTIEPAVGDINENTSHLAVLDVTDKITGQIAVAAKPLSGDLDGVVAATDNINRNLATTLDSANSINGSVDGIKGSTGQIRTGVDILSRRVDGIHRSAKGIAGSLSTVANQSSSMVTNLRGANAALDSILRATGPLNSQVRGIRLAVPQINSHARNIAGSPLLLRGTSSTTTAGSQWTFTTFLLNLIGGN